MFVSANILYIKTMLMEQRSLAFLELLTLIGATDNVRTIEEEKYNALTLEECCDLMLNCYIQVQLFDNHWYYNAPKVRDAVCKRLFAIKQERVKSGKQTTAFVKLMCILCHIGNVKDNLVDLHLGRANSQRV